MLKRLQGEWLYIGFTRGRNQLLIKKIKTLSIRLQRNEAENLIFQN